MSNTSNISKPSETYSRKTLAEQKEAFRLLGGSQQELARGKEAGTLKQELASKAYDLIRENPEGPLKVTVKAGRYPGTFELVGVE